MSERMTVQEAATLLGVSSDYIRFMMRSDRIHIGKVIKNRTGTGYRYLIFKPLVEELVGTKE